jgi:NAD(P) transhydrogenase
VPRGRIIGSRFGLLKILVDPDSMIILGVHIIGRIATELIHFGMLLVEEKIPVGRVASSVYNQPTLHELYKLAAFDAMRQKQGMPPISRGDDIPQGPGVES